MEDYKRKLELAKERYNSTTSKEEKEFIESLFPELKENEDEKIKKGIESVLKHYKENGEIICPYPFVKIDECLFWLKKQSEQKLCMIQWKGDNLKEVIGFTGKNKNFDKWFTSFEEYERYVQKHNNIFKLFNEDGSHYEVPVGAWIVKTPDGYNVASKAVLKQKSADMIEPKFKVGDWVMLDRPVLITKVEDMPYNTHQYWTSDGKWFGDATKAKLWTIQDAKDGDVLAYPDGTIVLFKYRLDGLNSGIYMSHILLATKIETCQSCAISKDLHPATKKQRDLLFQKMKEAGYEWDAEKKKLKKIEKNPIDKIEPKFKPGDYIIEKDLNECGSGTIKEIKNNKYYFTNGTCIDIQEQDLWQLVKELVEPKFKVGDIISYGISKVKIINVDKNKYNVTNSEIENDAHVCNLVVYFKDQEKWKLVESKSEENKKHPQPKQEWGEENEANMDYSSEIIGFLKNYIKAYGCTAMNSWVNWIESLKDRVQPQPKQEWNEVNNSMIEGIKIAILNYYDKENADEIISWLESIKERVQSQPKQEWNEKDDYAIEKLFCLLDNEQDNYPQLSCDFQEIEGIKDWLKSIKLQKQWKPSEEQMEALNAINNIGELSYVEQSDLLVKLYNDLKKL